MRLSDGYKWHNIIWAEGKIYSAINNSDRDNWSYLCEDGVGVEEIEELFNQKYRESQDEARRERRTEEIKRYKESYGFFHPDDYEDARVLLGVKNPESE